MEGIDFLVLCYIAIKFIVLFNFASFDMRFNMIHNLFILLSVLPSLFQYRVGIFEVPSQNKIEKWQARDLLSWLSASNFSIFFDLVRLLLLD